MADWYWNNNFITSMNVIFVLIIVFGFVKFKKINKTWIKGALIGAIPTFVIQMTLLYSRFQMMGADAALGFAMGAILALYTLVLIPVGAIVGYCIGRMKERKAKAKTKSDNMKNTGLEAMGIPFLFYALSVPLLFLLGEGGAGLFEIIIFLSVIMIPSMIIGFFMWLVGFFKGRHEKRFADIESGDKKLIK